MERRLTIVEWDYGMRTIVEWDYGMRTIVEWDYGMRTIVEWDYGMVEWDCGMGTYLLGDNLGIVCKLILGEMIIRITLDVSS